MRKLLAAMFVALLMVGCGEEAQEEAKREWSRVEQEEEEAKRIAKSIGWHDYKIIAEAIDWIELSANFTLNGHFGKRFAPNQQTPYTGWFKVMWGNGQLNILGQFKDGKEDGVMTVWYATGQKAADWLIQAGKTMSVLGWKPNGERCPVTNVVDGNGVVAGYYEYGNEKRRVTYKDGELVRD